MAAKSARSVLILCAIVTGALAAASSVSSTPSGPLAVSHKSGIPKHLQPHPPEHRLPTIDGASQPDLISDERAVSMFLLMAAHPDARAGAGYIRHIFNRKIEGNYLALTPEIIEGVRVASVEYSSKLKALYGSSHSAVPPNREALTLEYQSQVIRLLGPSGAERLLTTMRTRVKPNLRTFSKP